MSNLADKVLAQTRCSAELIKRAEERAQQDAAIKQAVDAAIPGAVQALLDNDRIEGHQKEAVAKGLEDHAACIELITKLAFHRNAQELSSIGTPGAEGSGGGNGSVKQASYSGAPVTDWDRTEAGQKFSQILFSGRQST